MTSIDEPKGAGGEGVWRPALDAILEGFQVIGHDFRYLYLNETAARHGRSTKAALLGRTMMECYPGIEATDLYARLRRCLLEREAQIVENAFTFPDGSVGHFELRLQPVPEGVAVLSIDITKRKQAEQARAEAEERLRLAQRMEAVGQLAAGLAHDFNNFLTVILGQGELALEHAQMDDVTADNVETILSAARASAQLTRQLLAYGQRAVMTREVVEVGEVVRGLEQILRRSMESRIELRFDFEARVARVEVDRSQIEQVLMNLVLNARDAIPAMGRITIGLAHADLDEAYVRANPEARTGPHTVLSVSDTGLGMDAATRARIFEPFFTTKKRGQGTGLGLATVYGIVRQVGGHLRVSSAPGEGSTFKVYLPTTERLPSRSVRAVTPAPPAAKLSGTVLIVEDAPALRELMRVVLVRAGLDVLEATSGEEAAVVWDGHAPSIALLITDLMMPGLSGPDLVRRVRQRRPELPIICTSGYAADHLLGKNMMPADVTFVEKPFTPKVLVAEARRLLAR